MPKTKAAQREYQRQWIAARRAAWLAGKSCATCGATDNLEVDHIDPLKKVTHRVWSWSEKRRQAELAKCQVLCTSCHLDKTLTDRPKAECGTASKYRAGCRCDDCKAAQAQKMRDYRAARQRAAHTLAA